MYLLYLDESGNPADASDRHFVLAGLAVFERRTYWIQQAAEIIKATHFPTAPLSSVCQPPHRRIERLVAVNSNACAFVPF